MAIEASPALCAAAFAAIERKLSISPPSSLAALPEAQAPVFVTLKTSNGNLRGCIGTFAAGPLASVVPSYAERAAFSDQRFKPLSKNELAGLQCTVSVLHSFERVEKWDDWCVGQHGVRITGEAKSQRFSSTFLPKVATEQGWSRRETMLQLLKKAGVPSFPESAWPELNIERYQHSECSLSYAAYRGDDGVELARSAPNNGSRCACS